MISHVNCNEWGWGVMKTDNKEKGIRAGRKESGVPFLWRRESYLSLFVPLFLIDPPHLACAWAILMSITISLPILLPALSSKRKKRKRKGISTPHLPILHPLGLQIWPLPKANWIGHSLVTGTDGSKLLHFLFILCLWLSSAAKHYPLRPLRVRYAWMPLFKHWYQRKNNEETNAVQNACMAYS